MAFLLNSQAQGVSGKNEQSTQTPWRGAPEAGPNAVASAWGWAWVNNPIFKLIFFSIEILQMMKIMF